MTLLKFTKNNIPVVAGAAVLALAAGIGFGLLGDSADRYTNDAFIRADYTVVTPRITGQILRVAVKDNQYVEQGQLLVEIDDRDLLSELNAAEASVVVQRAAVANASASLAQQPSMIAQADATLAASQAGYVFAKAELARYLDLAAHGAGSQQNAQLARSRIDTSQANVARDTATLNAARVKTVVLQAELQRAQGELQRAQAMLVNARLNLSYTKVLAPIAGWVGQRVAREGAWVTSGTAMLAVVPLNNAYVVANFQETQLENVRPGQRVDIRVDGFGGALLHGVVNSFAPATGVTFSAITPDNATGNFTKVVQRIPVKIELDAGQRQAAQLRVGMAVEATIHTAKAGEKS